MKTLSDEILAVLAKPNNAIVGVNRASGAPQLTPVWYAWDGDAFYFTTTRDRTKYLNLKRDPSISLIVDDAEMHKYIVAYGRAEIIEQNISEQVRLIVQRYAPPEMVEPRVQQVSNDPSRVIVVLRPEKIVTL